MTELALNLDKNVIDSLKTWRENPGALLPQLLKQAGASENWQLLTTHIGGLTRHDTAEVVVKLLDPAVEGQATQFGWDWSAKAAGTAELSVDVLSEKQLLDLRMQPADQHEVVGYSASFAVNASAGGAQKIGAWGSASVDGSLGGSTRLSWYVEAPHSRMLLDATLDAAKFARLPNDLEGMLRLAGNGTFWGLSMALEGSLRVGLSAKAEAGMSGWTYGFSGDKVDLGLAVHAGVSVKVELKGGMTLKVIPERFDGGDWGLRVELESIVESNKSFAGTIGAELDLSALASSAENALRAGLPELQTQALDALTLPGTAIKDRLTALLGAKIDDDSLRQLAALLLGQAEPAEVKLDLLKRLTGPLSDLLDKSLGALAEGSDLADGLVDGWLVQLLGKGKAADGLKAKLKDPIGQAATLAADELKAAIQRLTDKLKAEAGVPLDKLLKPLGALGDKLDKALHGLDKNAFSQAIKETLVQYHTKRTALLKALGDASKAKLGIELAFAVETSRKGRLAFSAWFGSGGDQRASQRLYQALCTGRLMLLGDLIDAAIGAKAVRDVSGWLSESLKRVSKASVTINFFGMSLSSSTNRLIDLEIKTDAWGNLMAASTLSMAESGIANPWTQRTTSLAVAANVVALPTGTKAIDIELRGAYTAQGKRTNRRWVQSLVDGYAEVMGRKSGANVGALLHAPDDDADGAKGFWRAVTVAMPIRLSADAWAQFQARPDHDIRLAFLKHGLRCLNHAYTDQRGFFKTSPEAELRRISDGLSGPKIADSNERVLAYLSLFSPVNPKSAGFDYLDRIGFGALTSAGFNSVMHSTPAHVEVGVFHRFAALLRAAVALKSCAGELEAALAPHEAIAPGVLRDRAEGPLRRMSAALSQAAVASETFLGLGFLGAADEGLPWALSTFALAMAELSGEEPPLPFGNRSVNGQESVVPLLTFF